MDPDFWHERWERGQIGFHQPQANPLLVRHAAPAGIVPGTRVFLPLCGKTRDIGWLLAQGIHVAGVELSPIAVADLFADLGVTPAVTGGHHAAPGLDIFCGDIFALDAATLGPIDAVYDRAALIALPPDMRADYAPHLVALTGRARQLLVTFEFDADPWDGPPFSVRPADVEALYAATYSIATLERVPLGHGTDWDVAYALT